MPKKRRLVPKWFKKVEAHDYPAAASYLSLIYSPPRVKSLVDRLKAAKITEFKAKDIFRASQLSLLGVSNSHVQRDQDKIARGQELSPLLLVADPVNGKVVIADGYHRLCAVYGHNEDAVVPAKIVALLAG